MGGARPDVPRGRTHVNFLCFRVRISIIKEEQVSVTLNDSIQVMVLLHRVWRKHPINVDFLGIYVPSNNQYSPLVHGLIGMCVEPLTLVIDRLVTV